MTKNPIAEAVEPRRAATIARAKTSAALFIDDVMQRLELKGWDLNAVAPRPSSNVSRREYKTMGAKRSTYQSLTRPASTSPLDQSDWKMDKPHRVVRDDKRCNEFIEQAGRDADVGFNSYISKLTTKVSDSATSEVVSAELDSGALWQHSHLTITRVDASVERWRTQMILNVSPLGTLFNQWPTRRVK